MILLPLLFCEVAAGWIPSRARLCGLFSVLGHEVRCSDLQTENVI